MKGRDSRGQIMRPLVSYIRVSTTGQDKSDMGFVAQREAIARFAAAEGFAVVAEYMEVETGKGSDGLSHRPHLASALDVARRIGGKGSPAPVAVAKLDRLSRDLHIVNGLMAYGVPFLVAELGHDAPPLPLNVVAAKAQDERHLNSIRNHDALAAAKVRGQRIENPRIAEAAEVANARMDSLADAYAAKVAPFVAAARAAGATDLRTMADALNRRGIAPPRGGKWHAMTVSDLLKRIDPDYAGSGSESFSVSPAKHRRGFLRIM